MEGRRRGCPQRQAGRLQRAELRRGQVFRCKIGLVRLRGTCTEVRQDSGLVEEKVLLVVGGVPAKPRTLTFLCFRTSGSRCTRVL